MRYYFDRLLDFAKYVYRTKSWPRVVFGAGVTLVAASVLGGASIIAELVLLFIQAGGDSNQPFASIVGYLPLLVLLTGIILIVVGGCAGFADWRAETSRSYGIAIELRGLQSSLDIPVESSIAFKGFSHKHSVIVDIRNQADNNAILQPEPAAKRIMSLLPTHLQSAMAGKKSNDVKLVFGGLASVPLTFLAGLLVDDETKITRVDWDRTADCWRALVDADDGDRFDKFIHRSGHDKERVVLCVSASYPVDIDAVCALHPDAKIVELRLSHVEPDNHWSDEKQRALSQQFLSTIVENSRFREIHLHIAAPSSMAFLFGQRYDKRNLPPVYVYQYERASSVKYPWAVLMPVAGVQDPEIVWMPMPVEYQRQSL